jgi:hypothetical protein
VAAAGHVIGSFIDKAITTFINGGQLTRVAANAATEAATGSADYQSAVSAVSTAQSGQHLVTSSLAKVQGVVDAVENTILDAVSGLRDAGAPVSGGTARLAAVVPEAREAISATKPGLPGAFARTGEFADDKLVGTSDHLANAQQGLGSDEAVDVAHSHFMGAGDALFTEDFSMDNLVYGVSKPSSGAAASASTGSASSGARAPSGASSAKPKKSQAPKRPQLSPSQKREAQKLYRWTQIKAQFPTSALRLAVWHKVYPKKKPPGIWLRRRYGLATLVPTRRRKQ